ncbi:polyprenyl synthetase family protein [Nesterenkonia ebinurensis]|uniref:polyprenyl synthetase family protein n=1 Tax=Nesterenkonia ebinurensis TaxID=2608252 RepID=UPI00168BB0D7|nr:polyprenyl synthetase family protein [Nesterenkonia ebinurensis]
MPTVGDTGASPFPPPGGSELVQNVKIRCQALLEDKRAEIAAIDPDAAPLVDALLELTAGGKKMRPLLGWLGWRAAAGDNDPEAADPVAAAAHPAVVGLGVALELFQAAALVHDDIIDRSATRRGAPSTHKRFESLHSRAQFGGDREHFGAAGGILSGDLALAWASEAFEQARQAAGSPAEEAWGIFRRMHTEVITGQYLDVLAEVDLNLGDEQALQRARRIAVYKSAKYSVEYPVLLGAALNSGSAALLAALSESTLPLGEAFQLQDDLLGVFGDPEVTGKPVGDDLREGKRTQLISYAVGRLPAAAAAELKQLLGSPHLAEPEVRSARRLIVESGALAEVARNIEQLREDSSKSRHMLGEQGAPPQVLSDLEVLGQALLAHTARLLTSRTS